MSGIAELDLFANGFFSHQGQLFNVNVEPDSAAFRRCFETVKDALRAPALGTDDWHEFGRATVSGTWKFSSSALAFRFVDEASFLTSGATEQKIAYLLFIYIEHLRFPDRKYMFIQRRHAGNPLHYFDDAVVTFDEIAHNVLFEPYSKLASRYEYIAVKPLSIERSALKKKTLLARDIRENISTLGLSRSIPSAVKLVLPGAAGQPDRRISINSTTKRLQEQSPKSGFAPLLEWVEAFASDIDNARASTKISSDFLGAFAQPVASMNGLDADCLLIDIFAIRQIFREDDTHKLLSNQGAEITLSEFETLLEGLGEAIPLNASATGFDGVLTIDRSRYPVSLRVLVKTCKLKIPALPFKIETGNVTERLDEFIERKKLYRVTLDHGAVLFSPEGTFRDGDLNGSAKMLTNIIHQEAQLSGVTSEKGSASTNQNFDIDSSFYVIRQNIAQAAKWLICDDSKEEWCDFLSYEVTSSGPKITWFHAKVKQKNGVAMGSLRRGSTSASGLQEVVGQAIKNLGRLRLRESSDGVLGTDGRAGIWLNSYQWPDDLNGTLAGFKRLCKHPGAGMPTAADITLMLKDFSAAAANPNTVYEVAIVVPNYRLGTLKRIFKRLGNSSSSRTAPQIFWLLSGYMSSCVEVGARPIIYCL